MSMCVSTAQARTKCAFRSWDWFSSSTSSSSSSSSTSTSSSSSHYHHHPHPHPHPHQHQHQHQHQHHHHHHHHHRHHQHHHHHHRHPHHHHHHPHHHHPHHPHIIMNLTNIITLEVPYSFAPPHCLGSLAGNILLRFPAKLPIIQVLEPSLTFTNPTNYQYMYQTCVILAALWFIDHPSLRQVSH